MHLKDGADKQILLLLVKIYSAHLHQHKEAHLLQFIQVPLQQLRVMLRQVMEEPGSLKLALVVHKARVRHHDQALTS